MRMRPVRFAKKTGATGLDSEVQQTPYEVYASLDLKPGGYTVARSTDVRRGVLDAIRRKLHRTGL